MKKIKAFLSFFLALTILVSCFGFNAFAEESGKYSAKIKVTYNQSSAREICAMINDMRKSSDAWYWDTDNKTKVSLSSLGDLTYDYSLEKIAMQRAAETALRYSHYRTDGTICFTAFDEFGYSAVNYGENIAEGLSSAAGINSLWREDDADYNGQGHRRNMLNPDFNAVGIAHVVYNTVDYWVEVFAKTANAVTTPAEALDGEALASVKIDSSIIENVDFVPEKVQAKYKKDVNAPEIKAELSIKEMFPDFKCAVEDFEKELSVDDTDFAELKDGKLTGKQLGKTQLSVKAFGVSKKLELEIICEHDYALVSEDKPTCTSTGINTYLCRICGHINQEEIPKLNHSMTHHEGVEPTCEKTGKMEYWHCSLCDKDYDDEKGGAVIDPDFIELPALGHKVKSVGDPVSATYFKQGLIPAKECSVCGKSLSGKTVIPKKTFGKIKLKSLPKAFKASWKGIAKASGFKLQYSLKKSLKSSKTVSVKPSKSYKVKGLKSKKTYYVRVRAFQKSGGKTLYSNWSPAASVKVK